MRTRIQGFTLVEVLVAMAIAVVLLALSFQMISGTTRLVDLSVRHMDAVTQMTFAFSRLDSDLHRAVIRHDLQPYVNTTSTAADDTALYFFATVAGYSGNRTLSVVNYSIGAIAAGDPSCLLRGSAGTSWLPTDSPLPVTFSTLTNASNSTIAAGDYQSLAPAIFRMDVAFVDKTTGSLKSQPANSDWSDVTGMLVTFAALDIKSRQPLGTNQDSLMKTLSSVLLPFNGSAAPSVGVYAQWETIANLQTRVTGMPAAVQGQLRIAQRYYDW